MQGGDRKRRGATERESALERDRELWNIPRPARRSADLMAHLAYFDWPRTQASPHSEISRGPTAGLD